MFKVRWVFTEVSLEKGSGERDSQHCLLLFLYQTLTRQCSFPFSVPFSSTLQMPPRIHSVLSPSVSFLLGFHSVAFCTVQFPLFSLSFSSRQDRVLLMLIRLQKRSSFLGNWREQMTAKAQSSFLFVYVICVNVFAHLCHKQKTFRLKLSAWYHLRGSKK